MRNWFKVLLVLVAALTLFVSLPAAASEQTPGSGAGQVVVANRASGTISVIDAGSDQLVGTYALPTGANTPEPMYVSYVKGSNYVFVGDRANSRVVAFDAADYSVVSTIPAGSGVFHQWADERGSQLWVNNDVDNTVTVIDPQALNVLGSRSAAVTMIGGSVHDWLIQFDTETFTEVNRAQVGLDPHVSLTQRNKLIYVPAQNSSTVTVLDRNDLALVTEIAVPGAHGAAMSPNGKVFYTTNLPGGGNDGLFAIDTRTNAVLGTSSTPFPVPHNLVISKNDKLFLTHSGGTSDRVTIYDVTTANPIPMLRGDVTVGLNPFGIAYVP